MLVFVVYCVLIYDKRNPAFQEDGNGEIAYTQVKSALRKPSMMRRCNWQQIFQHLRERDILPWLIDEIELKYGFLLDI